MARTSGRKDNRIHVRMLFAEEGGYHVEVLTLPGGGLEGYARLIDFLIEDEAVLRECYVDVSRLCAAQVVEKPD